MKPAGNVFLFVCLVAALAGSSALASLEEKVTHRDRVADELMYYPKGPAVEKAALGHTALAADLAWLRAVQYFGGHKRSDRVYTMMGHIIDIVTDLDPKFVNAYIFGGLVTAQDAGQVPEGIALMEKGLAHNPDDWQMNFETAFVHYTCEKNYTRAAELFRHAASLPGASDASIRFAAYVTKRAGDPKASLYLWQDFYNRTDNEAMKEKALEEIRRLEAGLKHGGG